MTSNSTPPLQTVDAIFDALGGSAAVMALTGVTTPQAVSNWRRRKRIPARHFTAMTDALAARRLCAPRGLWGMTPPDALSS